MSEPGSIRVFAPAKLNLFLELLGKRPDGYHELETVMVAVNRYDRIQIIPRDDPQIRVMTRWHPSNAVWRQHLGQSASKLLELPSGPSNLAYQAAQLMRRHCQSQQGFELKIEKTIPAGAGMGGASSDAAAVLRGVAGALNAKVAPETMHDLAAQLGSDVPFFLNTRYPAAIARGRGERLQPIPASASIFFVVVFPPRSLSTAEVYRKCLDCPGSARLGMLSTFLKKGDTRGLAGIMFNRLQQAACGLFPELAGLLRQMEQIGLAGCQLTGSGSACFGLAQHRWHAQRAVAQLKARGFRVAFVANPIVIAA